MQGHYLDEAIQIIEEAKHRNIVLRLMGACAIQSHCSNFCYLFKEMKRTLTDIDLMTCGRYSHLLNDFFKEIGYTPNDRANALYGHVKQVYYHKEHEMVEVYFDKLSFCHEIDLKGRLELDEIAISVSDLLLEKTQIVEINEKDVIDIIVLLREHEVGDKEVETINIDYISKLLSRDWGFYYTLTSSLNKVRNFLDKYEALSQKDRDDINVKIDRLLRDIENTPKSFAWKMRAKIGPSKKWYNEVEEMVR